MNLLLAALILSEALLWVFIIRLKLDNNKLFLTVKKLDEIHQPLWDFILWIKDHCKDSEAVRRAKVLLSQREE